MSDDLFRWLEQVEQWWDRLDSTVRIQPGQPLRRSTLVLLLMIFVFPIILLGWTWLLFARPSLQGWLMSGFSILFGVVGGSGLLLHRWIRWPYSRSRWLSSPIWHGTTWWLISSILMFQGALYATKGGVPLWVFVAMFAWVTVIYLMKLWLELRRSCDVRQEPSQRRTVP